MTMYQVDNISEAVRARVFPTITLWNRLEGRPRADKFDRALKAEVRDALWMLTRQWQFGEFKGDDAGSPISAKIQLTSTRLRKYQPDSGEVTPYDDTIPLETKVEHRRLALLQGGRDVALDLRLLMGRHWLKLMASLGNFNADFITAYPVHAPDPTQLDDAIYCAHQEAWSAFAAVAGKRMDGAKLYFHLKENTANHASDGIAALAGKETDVDILAARFIAWFEKLIAQPAGDDAWLPDRLEYQFAASAPLSGGERVLVADEYFQGHLDWYNVDIDDSRPSLGDPLPPDPDVPATTTNAVVPVQVTFNGMPNTRWWTFEDSKTNFGDIKPDTTDLAKLLLIEFGLIYANDWFLVPYVVPFGSLVRIKGMAVTNVFGERTWVEAAGRGADDDWQRWAMFLLNIKGESELQVADTSLLVLPAAAKVHEGRPLEEVMLLRDEIANMVWAVEKTIALPSGEPKSGNEAARELRQFFERDIERRVGAPPETPPPLAEDAKIRYEVMNEVPENWIPFIPVHLKNDNRQIQLQRAAMPRLIDRDPDKPKKVRPRTQLIREGLDLPSPEAYFVHEEEVPRAGIVVTQRFQRTRWRDGRAWVWFGARKQTGRGEGHSGLSFDRIVDAQGRLTTST
jgi:hypothetical protein